MKNLSKLIALSLMMSTLGFAKSPKVLPDIKQVISFTDLTNEQTQELFAGKLPEIAVSCEEGFEFPIRYIAHFGVASLNFAPNLKIRVDQTCYFRACGKKVYMSYDMVKWEKPTFYKDKMKVKAGFTPNKSEFLIEIEKDLTENEDSNESLF